MFSLSRFEFVLTRFYGYLLAWSQFFFLGFEDLHMIKRQHMQEELSEIGIVWQKQNIRTQTTFFMLMFFSKQTQNLAWQIFMDICLMKPTPSPLLFWAWDFQKALHVYWKSEFFHIDPLGDFILHFSPQAYFLVLLLGTNNPIFRNKL